MLPAWTICTVAAAKGFSNEDAHAVKVKLIITLAPFSTDNKALFIDINLSVSRFWGFDKFLRQKDRLVSKQPYVYKEIESVDRKMPGLVIILSGLQLSRKAQA